MGFLEYLSLDFLKRYFPRLYESVHVNLFRGQLNLNDVDLPSSNIFTLLSYPFYLSSGFISSLTLNIPWTHLSTCSARFAAHNVKIVLKEASPSDQTSVFATFLRDIIQLKNQTIANADPTITPLIRIIHKLFPTLIHRIDVDLNDIHISIQFKDQTNINLTLSSLSTSVPLQPSADIAKSFIIKDFSVNISTSTCTSVSTSLSNHPHSFSLSFPHLELGFSLTNARFDFDFAFKNSFSLSIHPPSLLRFVSYISKNQSRWLSAFTYQRPISTVTKNPLAWLRYAVRSVTASSRRGSILTQNRVLSVLRKCIRYEKLFQLRLRKRLSNTDETELEQLEVDLNINMIVMLREHAHSKVSAGHTSSSISTFSTTSNFLRLSLFGTNSLKSERQKIASEIRASVSELEDDLIDTSAINEEVIKKSSEFVRAFANWSRARISIRLECVDLCILGISKNIYGKFSDTVLLAELESDLNSYSISAKLGDIFFREHNFDIIRKGTVNENGVSKLTEERVSANLPIINVLVNKSAFDQRVSVNVQVQPLYFVLGLYSVRQWLQFGSQCLPVISKRMNKLVSNDDICILPQQNNQPSNLSLQRINYILDFSQIEFLIHDSIEENIKLTTSSNGLLFRLSDISAQTQPSSNMYEIRGRTILFINSCNLIQSGKNLKSVVSDAINVRSNIDASFRHNSFSLSFDKNMVKANISEAQSILKLLNSISKLSEMYSSIYKPEVAVGKSSPIVNVNISSLRMELFQRRKGNLLNDGLLLQFTNAQLNSQASGARLSLNELSVTELMYRGKLKISASAEAEKGIVVNLSKLDGSREIYTLEGDIGDISVSVPIHSLVKACNFVDNLGELIAMNAELKNTTRTALNHQPSQSFSPTATVFRTNMNLESFKIDLASPFRLCGLLTKVSVVGRENALFDVCCEDIELWDEMRKTSTGQYRSIINKLHRRIESRVIAADKRALTVNVGPNHINFQLSQLQATITHSLLRRIELIVDSLSSPSSISLGVATEEDGIEDDVRTSINKNTSRTTSSKRIMFRGSNLSIKVLEEPSCLQGVCLDIPQTTVVVTSNSQVVSLQKLSILTKIILNSSTTTNSNLPNTNSNIGSSLKQPSTVDEDFHLKNLKSTATGPSSSWRVLLRNLDADISHHQPCIQRPENVKYCNNFKDSWSVTILSGVVIFLAPSQVRCLTNVITQLSNEPESFQGETSVATSPLTVGESSHDFFEEKPCSSLPPSSLSPSGIDGSTMAHEDVRDGPCTSELAVRCETHVISLELFLEDDNGCVSSTVASIELDPALFSLKAVHEFSSILQKNITRSVTTWHATCPSFRLEDRGIDTPESRQIVVETEESWIGLHGSSNRLFQHEDVGLGLLVEGIMRTEDMKTTSSYHVELKRARVLLSSRLHAAIVNFCNLCSKDSQSFHEEQEEIPIPISTTRLEVSSEKMDSTSSNKLDSESRAPVSKVSILLVDPIVLLFSAGPNLGDSVFQIRAASIKGSLLFAEDGQLLPGSLIRIRKGHLFLLWMGDNENEDNSCSGSPSSANLSRRSNLNSALDIRQHGTRSLSSSLLNRFEQQRQLQAKNRNNALTEPEVESVLDVNSVTVRLPVSNQRYFSIVVPDIRMNASVSTIQNTIKLASCLDLGLPGDENAPVICPELRISVGSLLARVKVNCKSTGQGQDSLNPSHCENVDLVLNMSCDVLVEENVDAMSGEVKLSASVKDAAQEVTDQLLLPGKIKFKVEVKEQLSVDFQSDQFARLTLSPLTARTLTGIVSSLMNNNRSDNELTNQNGNVNNKQLGVRVSLKGIVVHCMAESPRMQILRLVLHGLKIGAVIPFKVNDSGLINLSIQDLVVEDTVSWSLPWRHGEAPDSVQWTKLVAGNHRGFRGSSVVWTNVQHVVDAFQEISKQFSTSRRSRRKARIESHEIQKKEDNNTSENSKAKHEVSPLISCVLKWVAPCEHVSAFVSVKGLDFNIDLGLLPSVLDWIQLIVHELNSINHEQDPSQTQSKQGNKKKRRKKKQKGSRLDNDDLGIEFDDEFGQQGSNIRIDHVVFEPVNIRVCIRAPPKRLEEGLWSWILGKILLEEEQLVDGVEIEIPRIVFNGDFMGTDRIIERVEAMYMRTLTSSKYLARQIIWQMPKFASMMRVLSNSMLRRRSDAAITQVESISFTSRGREWNQVGGVGLLIALQNDDGETQKDHNKRLITAGTLERNSMNDDIHVIDITGRPISSR